MFDKLPAEPLSSSDRSRSRGSILQHAAFVGFTSAPRSLVDAQWNPLREELEKVRRLYDDAIRVRPPESRDLSSEEQIRYLTNLVQLFENLRGMKSNLTETPSLETVKSEVKKHMQYLRTFDSAVFNKHNSRKTLDNQIDLLISRYQKSFSDLSTSDTSPCPSNEYYAEPVLNRLQTFLRKSYQQMKTKLNEKCAVLREKQEIYAKWERELVETINQDTSAPPEVRNLVLQMAAKREQIDRQASVRGRSSSISNNDYNPVSACSARDVFRYLSENSSGNTFARSKLSTWNYNNSEQRWTVKSRRNNRSTRN